MDLHKVGSRTATRQSSPLEEMFLLGYPSAVSTLLLLFSGDSVLTVTHFIMF